MTRPKRFSAWRKIALATWPRPSDPLIRAVLDVKADAALDYLEQVRRATGVHVTLTHLVGRAAALAIAAMPEINGRVVAGMALPSPTIDVFFMVSLSGELGVTSEALATDTSGIVIRRADEKPPWAIAEEMARLVSEVRSNRDPAFRVVKAVTERVPALLLKPFLGLASLITEGLGIGLPMLGVRPRSFGSIGISNVGPFGVQTAFSPMPVISRTIGGIMVGTLESRPVAENGEVVIRPILPLTATVDHRLMDGYQGALLARELREYLLDPAQRDPVPPRRVRRADREAGRARGPVASAPDITRLH